MKRWIKNSIISAIMVSTILSMYFTMNYIKSNNLTNETTNNNFQKFNKQENINDNENTSGTNDNTSDEKENMTPDNTGEENVQMPDRKSSNRSRKKTADDTTDNQTQPSDNNSNNEQMPDDMTPPNQNDNSQNGNMMPPDMKDGNMNFPNMHNDMNLNNNSISSIYYVLFGVESLILSLSIMYLILSRFNKKSFKETLKSSDKIIILILGSIILTASITYLDGYITNNYFLSNNLKKSDESGNVEATANTLVEGSSKTLKDEYETDKSDESVILVQDDGEANIEGAKIKKKGGDSTNTENSEFYGINAGVLVKKGSKAKIKKSSISTNAVGSNAVFSTGENSKIYVSDSTITTTGKSSSRGLDATYGGYIEADNVDIKTEGDSSATLATDRGEGTVIANNSTLETNGKGSPVIYSTGDIQISNTSGVSNNSQIAVVEGMNSVSINSSNLKASGAGNRGDVDQAGVMIYQSMSGDASVGVGTFTSTDSTLEISSESEYYKTAPMFFITNTKAVINLLNTDLKYGSNILISSKGTEEWGNVSSNGGDVTLNATNQELVGNIEVDSISIVSLNLTNSTYKGCINSNNSAKEINLKLDKESKITLTGDSYVSTLEDEDEDYSNINFNGYKLYVGGNAIN